MGGWVGAGASAGRRRVGARVGIGVGVGGRVGARVGARVGGRVGWRGCVGAAATGLAADPLLAPVAVLAGATGVQLLALAVGRLRRVRAGSTACSVRGQQQARRAAACLQGCPSRRALCLSAKQHLAACASPDCTAAHSANTLAPHTWPPHLADAVVLGAALAGVGCRLFWWGGCVGHTVDGLGAAVAVLASRALDQALALAVGHLQMCEKECAECGMSSLTKPAFRTLQSRRLLGN